MSGWIRAFVLLSLGLILILTRSEAGPPVNHPKQPCQTCHLAGDETTPANASQLSMSQEALCGQCHPDALTVAHPSGFRPNRPLPAVYPVDWKGDITCSTCHEVHSEKKGRLRGTKRYKEMCLSCHDKAFFARMVDEGLSIQRNAHIGAQPADLSSIIDAYSLHCISCHTNESDDGAVQVDERGLMRHEGGAVNHPIGRVYAQAMASARLHPQARLRKEIMLPEGKVSCVSCHMGFAAKHGALIISNRGSALCLECHDL